MEKGIAKVKDGAVALCMVTAELHEAREVTLKSAKYYGPKEDGFMKSVISVIRNRLYETTNPGSFGYVRYKYDNGDFMAYLPGIKVNEEDLPYLSDMPEGCDIYFMEPGGTVVRRHIQTGVKAIGDKTFGSQLVIRVDGKDVMMRKKAKGAELAGEISSTGDLYRAPLSKPVEL